MRTTYFVSPGGERWRITREGGTLISRHSREWNALRLAIEMAHANPPSQVAVQRPNGQFQIEWTYGKDPYPSYRVPFADRPRTAPLSGTESRPHEESDSKVLE